jgi:predicted phage terminase large subunit-like protein
MADGSLFEHPQMELPDSLDELIQSWDMAFKDTKSSDFVAGGVWARAGADKFMLDLDHRRMDIAESIRAVRAMTEKWPETHAKIIEDKANGPAVIGMLHGEISGLIAYDPKTGKEGRVNAVSPLIESGNVYLPHPSLVGWVDGMIDECAAFPNGAHDDRVDQMTQALLRWQIDGGPLLLWGEG